MVVAIFSSLDYEVATLHLSWLCPAVATAIPPHKLTFLFDNTRYQKIFCNHLSLDAIR